MRPGRGQSLPRFRLAKFPSTSAAPPAWFSFSSLDLIWFEPGNAPAKHLPAAVKSIHLLPIVLSRLELFWATDMDIQPFLCQPKLVDDFLAGKLDTIEKAKTAEQKHAIIWCVNNLIPIKQFNPRRLNIIFYENLCVQPEVEIPKIFRAIGRDYRESVFEDIKKPSITTSHNSAIMSGENKVTRWKRMLSHKQTDNILSIVREFDLDFIYGDSSTPLITNL